MKRATALVQPVRTLRPVEWEREAREGREAIKCGWGPGTPRRGPR